MTPDQITALGILGTPYLTIDFRIDGAATSVHGKDRTGRGARVPPSRYVAGQSQAEHIWEMRVLSEGLKRHWAVSCKDGNQDEKEGVSMRSVGSPRFRERWSCAVSPFPHYVSG